MSELFNKISKIFYDVEMDKPLHYNQDGSKSYYIRAAKQVQKMLEEKEVRKYLEQSHKCYIMEISHDEVFGLIISYRHNGKWLSGQRSLLTFSADFFTTPQWERIETIQNIINSED